MADENGQENGFTIYPDNNGKGELIRIDDLVKGLTFNLSWRGSDPLSVITEMEYTLEKMLESGNWELNERCIHHDFRRPKTNQPAQPPPPVQPDEPEPHNAEWEQFNQDIDAGRAQPTNKAEPLDMEDIKRELRDNDRLWKKTLKKDGRATKARHFAYVEMITPKIKQVKQKDKCILEMQGLMYVHGQTELQKVKFTFWDNWDAIDKDMKWKNPFTFFGDLGRELWTNAKDQIPVRVDTIIAVNSKQYKGETQYSMAAVIEPDEFELDEIE